MSRLRLSALTGCFLVWGCSTGAAFAAGEPAPAEEERPAAPAAAHDRAAEPADGVAGTSGGADFFRRRILPVLETHCYRCHSARAERPKGGLRLDTPAGLVKGGDTAAAVIRGNVEESLLIAALRYESIEMPPRGQLPEAVIADFVAWVKMGAPDPRSADTGVLDHAVDFTAARRFWSFQPIARAPLPAAGESRWPRQPLDHFVLSALEEKGLSPAPPATRRELIRRLSFDLTGLPPEPEDVADFVRDESPYAYEKLVDRLLASSHYGERWGQHWLDVVRYAETEGFEYDRTMPGSWRYRDYVIDAFNSDKPFDRFATEQLAGDEVAPEREEALIAAGFHRLGSVRRNAGNQEVASSRNEILTERTDIVGAAFLGLTIGCARCHDHKFDPILQKDYYRVQAFLAATRQHNVSLASPEEEAAWKRATESVEAEIKRLKEKLEDAEGSASARKALETQLEAATSRLPAPLPSICTIRNDARQQTPIHVLVRGDWGKKGERVGPRPLSVLLSDSAPELSFDAPHPRTQLARWILEEARPLTARVLANRLWSHHFGTGIVKTPNDFGVNGDRPSHPELLDYLANELVAGGWQLKRLHRLMLLSSTYRQSARSPHAQSAAVIDPENRLLWRFSRRRLDAEEIRDAMLSAAGGLNRKAGGPSVIVPVEEELVRLLYNPSQWAVTQDPVEHQRRSVYLFAKRNLRLPFLEVFDQPALLTSCAERESSTHAPQALELLNGKTSNALAAAFARRLVEEAGADRRRQVRRAFLLTAGRLPRSEEESLALEFLREAPLEEFTLALFNLNAFLYVN